MAEREEIIWLGDAAIVRRASGVWLVHGARSVLLDAARPVRMTVNGGLLLAGYGTEAPFAGDDTAATDGVWIGRYAQDPAPPATVPDDPAGDMDDMLFSLVGHDDVDLEENARAAMAERRALLDRTLSAIAFPVYVPEGVPVEVRGLSGKGKTYRVSLEHEADGLAYRVRTELVGDGWYRQPGADDAAECLDLEPAQRGRWTLRVDGAERSFAYAADDQSWAAIGIVRAVELTSSSPAWRPKPFTCGR